MDTNKPLEEKKPMTPPVEGTAIKTTAPTVRIIESDATSPLPGVRAPMVKLDMTKNTDTALNFDKDTVVYLIYLLYKTNMIARNNLRNMIDEISKPLPNDPLKWLVNEAAKAGR